MTSTSQPEPAWADYLPLSALNHLLYCPRRCALIHLEGWFEENRYTAEGRVVHDRADTPGYEVGAGVRAERTLPLASRRLRLAGIADIVEFRDGVPYPVDYKRGRRKRYDNDEVQLCAQALCLEEMLGVPVPSGALFHAASRRRREVAFDGSLRRATEAAALELHRLVAAGRTPAATPGPRCRGCSLVAACLPQSPERLARAAAAAAETFRPEALP